MYSLIGEEANSLLVIITNVTMGRFIERYTFAE